MNDKFKMIYIIEILIKNTNFEFSADIYLFNQFIHH